MSSTVSRSTSSPNLQLFRSNATSYHQRAALVCVLKTASSSSSSERGRSVMSSSEVGPAESYAPSLLKNPTAVEPPEQSGERESDDDDEWSVWENRILEDTVPLVGFVRTVIHSGKYKVGDTLSPEHQNIILERLLPYHPQYEEKIGCGVESITVGFHTEFKGTKCLFIVRRDGDRIDFSYWKCIKGLIRKKYPLHADAFIFRHFRRRRRNPRI